MDEIARELPGNAAVGEEKDDYGGDDPGLKSSIPRTERERTTRRCRWWSSICVGRLESPARRDGELELGSAMAEEKGEGESRGVDE